MNAPSKVEQFLIDLRDNAESKREKARRDLLIAQETVYAQQKAIDTLAAARASSTRNELYFPLFTSYSVLAKQFSIFASNMFSPAAAYVSAAAQVAALSFAAYIVRTLVQLYELAKAGLVTLTEKVFQAMLAVSALRSLLVGSDKINDVVAAERAAISAGKV